ncbi:MAG: NACHT domain-containing protein [Rubrivivax sp.]|nr:MAG: NACHT domain-containing protein [Rubrivivax sp.]
MFEPSSPSAVPSVTSPPDGVPPAPPVATRAQCLPFGGLTWENFERLCHRLMSLEGDVEHCVRYGRQGDAQAGIDVYARRVNGRYHCLQAKRHQSFSAAQIRKAVDLFLDGSWASRTECFTIAVQSSLRSTTVQDEIEQQAARLSAQGIVFLAVDGEELTNQLRNRADLIDDYFGRPWVQALLGDEAVAGLKARLDGAAFAKVRGQLTRVYESHFHSVDPGSFGSIGEEEGRSELTLLERFIKPDILVREAASSQERSDGRTSVVFNNERPLSSRTASEFIALDTSTATSRLRRLPLHEWIGEAQRLIVLGDAGCGKSTLLRVIALDLMHEQVHFPELAQHWGRRLPVYIPFARWTAQTAYAGGIVGIKEIVRRSLDQLLTGTLADLIDQAIDDGRVLLLIDGLDEWSNEQAARTTLNALVTTVEAHGIPVVVSSRPRGLEKIGSLPTAWRRGTVAPLSVDQQVGIASRWFFRFSSEHAMGVETSAASLRTSRFMAELARDANLAALTTTPLMLIGLVTLALRGQILPRTRNDIYDQLVRVLLEVHPSNRATAAGDTESRFRHANDPDQRRAAIAHLAFAIREQAGGGTMSPASGREILRAFLASPLGFAIDSTQAARAAGEILSVNSETQGLIVEKGPNEIGFVHASFEEYLGAEHIGGWSFEAITDFVRNHAGEARWRNVITNLLGYLQRRDEVDRLVAVIEEPCIDELSQLNRQALLGDIAFGISARVPTTAKRLALAAMQRVESEDWLPARREALGSVLRGLSDPTLKTEIAKHLARWLPSRQSWPASLIETLGSWQPTQELQDTLFRAMHGEDRSAQRAAAKVFAKVFSPSESVCQRLVDGLARSRDLHASAALLECLAHGWPTVPSATALFQQAWDSHRGALRLAGAFGLATGGTSPQEMRDQLLQAQSVWSLLSHSHRLLAAQMLATYWLDDPELIRGAVARLSLHGQSPWEYDSAQVYLLSCDLNRPELRRWVLRELSGDHPFISRSVGDQAWQQVGRLAAIDPEIRSAAKKYWQDPQNRLIGMHQLVGYVTHVADPEVAAVLLEILANDEHGFNRYWALAAILVGWGRDHPAVSSALEAVIASPDEQLEELVSLLPAVYADKAEARQRLLCMGLRPSVRRDLLTDGFAQCGCDGTDDEAVQAILSHIWVPDSIFDPTQLLFQTFGTHPAVRSLAAKSLRTQNAALTAIAAGFPNDPEFTQPLLDAAIPLPAELRTQIVELATEGATGTALEAVLGQAMLETDPDLRVRMIIASYGRLPLAAREGARQELLKRALAVGPDFYEVRASALAGLTAIGALDKLFELQDHGKPVHLYTGMMVNPLPSLERQICERFADFESIFGDGLPARFETLGNRSRLAEILSVAPGASPAARVAFRTLAERGELPHTVAATRALAAERPRSALLLQHCWDVLERQEKNNTSAMVNGDIAVVLREHFPDDGDVQSRLVALYRQSPAAETAITLAVYSPGASELPPLTKQGLGHHFGDWTVAVHVAAYRADSHEFASLLEAMVTRDLLTQFDAQEITNLAVQERLQRDPELEQLLCARLRPDVDRSISGSFARYLAAAGKLGASVPAKVAELLRTVTAEQSLPLAGYDAIADDWRATRATLLDALSAGGDLV